MSAGEPVSRAEAVQVKGHYLLLIVLVAGHAFKHIFNAGFFIILPEIKAGLGLTNAGVGMLSTVRTITGGPMNLPAGFLADRFSERFVTILALSITMVGVFHFALGRVETYWQAIVVIIFAMVAIVTWHPAAIGALSRAYSSQRGFVIALHGSGGNIGGAVGPILVGSLLVVLSWRVVLQGSLVPAIIAGLLIWMLLRSVRVESTPVTAGSYLRSFAGLLRNRKLLLILLITGGYAAAQISVTTFLPVYIREDLGRSSLVLGGYLTLVQVMGIGSQPLMGYLSDRLGRKAVIFPSLLGMGLSFLGLYLVPPGLPFILVLAVMGAFMFSIMVVLLVAASDLVAREVQGTVASLVYGAWAVFAGISPLVAGLIADAVGVRNVFLYASAIAVTTSFFALVTPWQRR